MESEDTVLVEALGKYYGFDFDELEVAERILNLGGDQFAVRFTEFVSFSRSFGVAPADLARFIADSGSGIAPWRNVRIRPPE